MVYQQSRPHFSSKVQAETGFITETYLIPEKFRDSWDEHVLEFFSSSNRTFEDLYSLFAVCDGTNLGLSFTLPISLNF